MGKGAREQKLRQCWSGERLVSDKDTSPAPLTGTGATIGALAAIIAI